jgi:hypothetical protein
MSNVPFHDPVSWHKLDRHGLEDLLRSFEDAWAGTAGERITSAEFYDRYRGDLVPDTLFTIAWSSYYEIYRRLGSSAHKSVVESLVAAG